MSFDLEEFEIDRLIRRRDLLSAIELATQLKRPILQEKIRFRYGESMVLLIFLLDMLERRIDDPKLTINTRFNILRIGLRAIKDNRIEVIDYLRDLAGNYLAILEWVNQIGNFKQGGLSMLNSIFEFSTYLPAIKEISPDITAQLCRMIIERKVQGSLGLLLSGLEERILEDDPTDIDFHDYSKLAEIAISLLEKVDLLADYEQYNNTQAMDVLCKYFSCFLVHDLSGKLLSKEQLRFLMNALHFYHLYAKSPIVRDNDTYRYVAKQVFEYLTNFFNKQLLDILQNRNISFSDLEIGNSCRRISQAYYGLGEGQLGFYFQLMSQKHWQNVEPAIDEYFQKKTVALNFRLPDYMYGVNYQFDVLLFELFLERLTYLDALDDHLKEREIERIRSQGSYKNNESFDFLIYLFRQNNSDEHSLLWQGLNFSPFAVQVQTRLLFHILQYDKQDIETIQSWFLSGIFKQLDNYSNAFSADVIQAYRSFYEDLQNMGAHLEYPAVTQFIFDNHWAYLQQVAPELNGLGVIRDQVQQLGRSTITFATIEDHHNYECFYRFIQFWSNELGQHYFQGRGNKGFNRHNFVKLCKLVKDALNRKYASMELYYWPLTKRNIIDEINILLDKNTALA